MILRLGVALAALLDLGIARLLPETGGGLFFRLGAATIVVLLPGGLLAEALGLRLTSATLVWTLLALAVALAVAVVLHASFAIVLLVLVAVVAGAVAFAPRGSRPSRLRGAGPVVAAGVLLGALLWHVAPGAVQGDGLFHLARVRKLVELDSLSLSGMNELVGGGLHPGYAFPLWHTFLAAVAKLAGVDSALVVQHESALLVPVALLVAFEAGTLLFRSAWLGAATTTAQAALICFAPGHGGAYPSLDLPATASRQLLVPAALTLVFAHYREPARRTLASVAAAALVLALVHPTYALFLALVVGGWLAVRAVVDRNGVRAIAAALAALVAPAAAVAVALLPVVNETVSHDPSAAARTAELRHYGHQLVVGSETHFRLAGSVFTRGGAIAVAALALVPLAVLATRRQWSSFVLGASLAVFVLTLVPFLFVPFADVVSLSQSRRLAGFVPLAFALVGGAAVLTRVLAVFVLPLALAAGILLQAVWAGDFGYTAELTGPSVVTWLAFGGAAVAVAVAAARRLDVERPGLLAAGAVALFALPVVVHGFRAWTPASAADPNALTPGLVRALRDDVPERGVVFSDLETSYRIAAAAPVLVAAAPPAHVANTTKNAPYRRRRAVIDFLRTGDLAIPRRFRAQWLVVDRTRRHPQLRLKPVYADGRYSLFRL